MNNKIFADLLLMIIGILFFPLIYNTILTTDTSIWTFTGHEVAAVIFPVLQWFYLLAVLLVPIYDIQREVRH